MNIDVLALKYRPKFFKEVTGQDLVIETLTNSINLSKIHNAYLFSGTRGMGKTTIARLFAKSLLCETKITSTPCGECSACSEIDMGNHLDLIEIDAASRTKVEDTRSILENVQYAPSSSRFKIYLIDEVHMLSTKSFNALLKTIEEPPSHVKFLLATTEPEKLPDTILSRCLHFKLATATESIITNHLEKILKKEKLGYELDALKIIAKNANGSIRDSLSILEQCISYTNQNIQTLEIKKYLGVIDERLILDLIKYLSEKDRKKIVTTIDTLDSNANYESLTDNIIIILFKLYLMHIDIKNVDQDNSDLDFYLSVYDKFTSEDLQLYYQIAVSSKKDYRYSPSKKDHFTMIMLRMILFIDDESEILKNESSSSNRLKSKRTSKNNDPVPSIRNKDTMPWSDIVNELNLDGLTLHLAKHSVLKGIDTDSPILQVNEDKKEIYPAACLDNLISKIKKYFEIDHKIVTEFHKNLMTPITLEALENENELNDRYEKVKNDPDITKLKEVFGGDIDKELIKKITE